MEIFIKKSVLRTDKSKIFNQKYWLKKVAPQLQEYPTTLSIAAGWDLLLCQPIADAN